MLLSSSRVIIMQELIQTGYVNVISILCCNIKSHETDELIGAITSNISDSEITCGGEI